MQDISWLGRTSLLIGEEKVWELTRKHVMIVGMGGVGSFAAECFCRAGIGSIVKLIAHNILTRYQLNL